MNIVREHISVFEHQTLKLGQRISDVLFDETKLKALQSYFGESGVPYFQLIHNGVKFNSNVGVLQVGTTLYEVLPKADKNETDKEKWRSILIGMLKAVKALEISSTSNSSLKLKANSILDLYFEIFIRELEHLFHCGLIKKYNKIEGNVSALKGSIHFAKHIQRNIVRQDRFYVRYQTYDVNHLLHRILYKALRLLKRINNNWMLQSRIESLLLCFPELPDIVITEASFRSITYNRKNSAYKISIDIARLLLLNYHPDVSRGKHDVLALMFDMNKLWEEFVLVSLRKYKPEEYTVTGQFIRYFWKPEIGTRTHIRPDVLINPGKSNCCVLDVKWKIIDDAKPSASDLRQMFVYHEYFRASKVALVYPGKDIKTIKGNYLDPDTSLDTAALCSVITILVNNDVRAWQKNIASLLLNP